jgi:glycosyl transferase family 1
MKDLRILFVGATWNGSTARSTREALAALPGVYMDDLGEDNYFPRGTSWLVRGTNRLLRPWHRAELERAIVTRLAALQPDILMVCKGTEVSAETVRRAKQVGTFTANIFPDCSPHAHGEALREAMGEYDLVVSTKPFHPDGWGPIYGYRNRCVFVPHGYDPAVHYWPDPPGPQTFDIVLAATCRPQYQAMMQHLASALKGEALRVGIIGSGWRERATNLPLHWEIEPPLVGRAYGEWIRRGRIVIAPVHRDMVTRGVRQPGDEDTMRTYELAAAGCFFLHRRTPYAQVLYDEATEVPMWDNVEELATLVRKYLPLETERRTMAARAHARAVPKYSISYRAKEILEAVKRKLAQGKTGGSLAA